METNMEVPNKSPVKETPFVKEIPHFPTQLSTSQATFSSIHDQNSSLWNYSHKLEALIL
jgi:hypothetical protein